MKNVKIKSLISLVILTIFSLQNICAQDLTITSTQLKQTNLVFIERDYLHEKDSLNQLEIKSLKEICNNYQQYDSLLFESLKDCENYNEELSYEIEKVNKRSSIKDKILYGLGTSNIILILIIILT